MNITKFKKPFVLTVLFFLPVLFLLFLYPSKHNYKTLDILKKDLPELTNFVDKNGDDLLLENHITVLGFLGETPMEDAILALNLKELVYDKFRGFKRFQIVVLVLSLVIFVRLLVKVEVVSQHYLDLLLD